MPEVIAFFDMDYTLLDTSSGLLYVQYLRRTGQIGRRVLARVAGWTLLYKLALIDMARAMPHMVAYVQNASAGALWEQSRRWFTSMAIDHLSPIGVAKIQAHQRQGHVAVVISASTQFAVRPVAEHLGLEYLCTQLAVEDDRVTGEIVPPPCYGEGKVHWARQLADRYGIPIGRSYFYTDSLSDLPLLEIVEHPIAVNPDPPPEAIGRSARLAGPEILLTFGASLTKHGTPLCCRVPDQQQPGASRDYRRFYHQPVLSCR